MTPIDMFDLNGKYEMTFASAKEAEKYFPGGYQRINLATRKCTIVKKQMTACGKIWKKVPNDLKKFVLNNCLYLGGPYICLRSDLIGLI